MKKVFSFKLQEKQFDIFQTMNSDGESYIGCMDGEIMSEGEDDAIVVRELIEVGKSLAIY